MPLYPPQDYRKTDQTHRIGLAADRPAAADVLPGTLYFSTNTLVLERSDGAAWANYSPTGGTPGAQGGIGPSGLDGEVVDNYLLFQGQQGPTGASGSAGPAGSLGPPGLEGESLEEYSLIPGPQGAAGPQGVTGIIVVEADEPELPLIIPGTTGLQGPQGVTGFFLTEPDDPELPLIIQGPAGRDGSAGGGITLNNFTKDLGASNRAGTFDVTGLAGLSVDKNVVVVQTMQKIASKGDARDEFELQPIILTGYVVDAATIRALWHCDDVCVGTYAFAYAVSG